MASLSFHFSKFSEILILKVIFWETKNLPLFIWRTTHTGDKVVKMAVSLFSTQYLFRSHQILKLFLENNFPLEFFSVAPYETMIEDS